MGKLTIKRTNQYANKLRKIQVFLDDEKFCAISNGEIKSFDIPDGQHTLFAKIDWCKTEPVNINIDSSREKIFELGSPIEMTSVKLFSLIVSLFFIAGVFVAAYLHNVTIIYGLVIAMVLWQIVKYLFMKKKMQRSPLYYLTIGRKEYIYLREI